MATEAGKSSATFTAKPGQKIRLRIINAGGDTAFRFGVAEHPLTITHTDGYPIQPFEQVTFADWRRVLVVRVGRTVSVLDVSFTGVRPPRGDVVALGELAAERLRSPS